MGDEDMIYIILLGEHLGYVAYAPALVCSFYLQAIR